MASQPRNTADDDTSVFRSLLVPVVLVAVVGLLAWGLLVIAKGIVVAVTYAVGIAVVVVTVLLARRLLRGHTGRARLRRIGSLVAAVLLGAVLIVVAHEVSRHGWLLIALPAGVVAIWMLVGRVTSR